MRRMYVVSKKVWLEHAETFHPTIGSHFIDLEFEDKRHGHEQEDQMILVSIAFASEGAEDKWHGHPDVAILPHPTHEGMTKIKDAKAHPAKKMKQSHVDALKKHSKLGFDEQNDTILDLSEKAKKIHPECCIRNVL
ncbi:MAG TPA: hypothetical protein VN622_17660 [Clostridia bacterium]|nr:hypothetical protein [Clostridia bacterium]